MNTCVGNGLAAIGWVGVCCRQVLSWVNGTVGNSFGLAVKAMVTNGETSVSLGGCINWKVWSDPEVISEEKEAFSALAAVSLPTMEKTMDDAGWPSLCSGQVGQLAGLWWLTFRLNLLYIC